MVILCLNIYPLLLVWNKDVLRVSFILKGDGQAAAFITHLSPDLQLFLLGVFID